MTSSSNVNDDLDELIKTEESKKQESPVNFDAIDDAEVNDKEPAVSGSGWMFRPLLIAMVSLFVCQFVAIFFIFKIYVGDKPEVDLTPMNQTFSEVVKLAPKVENISSSLELLKKDIELFKSQVVSKEDLSKVSDQTTIIVNQIAELKGEHSQMYNAIMEVNVSLKAVASDSSKLTGAVRQIQNNVASSNQASGLSPSAEPKKEEQSGYRYKFKHIEVQEK